MPQLESLTMSVGKRGDSQSLLATRAMSSLRDAFSTLPLKALTLYLEVSSGQQLDDICMAVGLLCRTLQSLRIVGMPLDGEIDCHTICNMFQQFNFNALCELR